MSLQAKVLKFLVSFLESTIHSSTVYQPAIERVIDHVLSRDGTIPAHSIPIPIPIPLTVVRFRLEKLNRMNS